MAIIVHKLASNRDRLEYTLACVSDENPNDRASMSITKKEAKTLYQYFKTQFEKE